MKNNVKFLSALLVSVMGLGLTTTNKANEVKDENGPLIVKDVLRANAVDGSGTVVNELAAPTANNLVSDVLAQITSPNDGKVNIRFVAGIDSYAYNLAQFNITLKDADGEVVRAKRSYQVNSAYLGIEVEGETQYPSDLWGEGYNYLIAYTLTDVPSDYWNYNFEVTASIGSDVEHLTTSADSSSKVIADMIENNEEDNLGDAQPISIVAALTHIEGAGIIIYLADKPAININDMTLTLVSFESSDFANYETQMMNAGIKTKSYDSTNGYMYLTVENGFPKGSDVTIVVNISYQFNGVNYSQDLTFVGNAYEEPKSLDQIKLEAITELEGYANESNYLENWSLVREAISTGTTAINNATSKDEVKTALANAKAAIDAIDKDNLGDAQPISIVAAQTHIEGAGIIIYLADKPAININDMTLTLVSFESSDFANYETQMMNAGIKTKSYDSTNGYMYLTVENGFPKGSDVTIVVNISYQFKGVYYSQDLTFVGNAYKA